MLVVIVAVGGGSGNDMAQVMCGDDRWPLACAGSHRSTAWIIGASSEPRASRPAIFMYAASTLERPLFRRKIIWGCSQAWT